MLQPVLPPIPPIIQTAPPGNSIPVDNNSKTSTVVQAPEILSPEFSPLNSAKTADLLKGTQAISFPILKVPSLDGTQAVIEKNISVGTDTYTSKSQNNTNLSLTKELKSFSESTPSQTGAFPDIKEPVKNIIQFKTRNKTSQIPTPPSVPIPVDPNNQIQIQIDSPNNPPNNPNNNPNNNPTNNSPSNPSTTPTPGNTPPIRERIVEIVADKQEYDERRGIVFAEGNVIVRFDGSVVDAERVQVNLQNLIAVGEGNVALTRGDQVLRGSKFTYNFLQDSGDLQTASGEIFIPSADRDLAFAPGDTIAGGVPARPPSDRIRSSQPLTNVASPGEVNVNVGGRIDARNIQTPKQGGQVRRLRFEAGRIEFFPRGWEARDVRITNDPFSPPELLLRADKVNFTREAPLRDRITTQRQRLQFDQGFTIPIPIDNQVIDRRERNVTPAIVSFGFDSGKRGGLFIERSFQPFNSETFQWSLTPQFYAQKAVQDGGDFASLFGLKTRLSGTLSPTATIEGNGELTNFKFDQVEDNLRASLRLRQLIGKRLPHLLTTEYSYRDRLFNGTLGFQTVQSSLGTVLTSPNIPLGNGFNLNYQTGAQYIDAETDRFNLAPLVTRNGRPAFGRVSLGRFQGSAEISKGFSLWQGKPLAPTATEALRYSSNPVVPYFSAVAALRGTGTLYTSGDNQSTLTGTVGLQGQFGHFSKPFLDYTAFKLFYSQGINSGTSPFLFDRSVDNKVLTAGLTQQIYGPFRFGFETSINLDNGRSLSNDYYLEYSRRTYGVTLRYNPELGLGGISFRINDFNWSGGTDPFSDSSEIRPVINGVRQN